MVGLEPVLLFVLISVFDREAGIEITLTTVKIRSFTVVECSELLAFKRAKNCELQSRDL